MPTVDTRIDQLVEACDPSHAVQNRHPSCSWLRHSLNSDKASSGTARASCSLGDSVGSGLEVAVLLGGSESDSSLLVLAEASAGSLGALGAEVLGSAALLRPLVLGGGSSLLVDDGEVAGNGLSDNL